MKKYLSVNKSGSPLHIPRVDAPLAPVPSSISLPKKFPMFTLERLSSSHDIPALSIYSAARTCKVPISYVLSSRKKQDASRNDCIYWTLDTITFYTLLFGAGTSNTWNVEHFGQVIDNILSLGTTGYAASDPILEDQLIASVRGQVKELGDAGQQSKQAFYYAEQAYVNYLIGNIDLENPSQQSVLTPQQMQTTHALGTYVLNVADYRFVPIVPRIFTHGQWLEAPEQQFEVEIVNTTRTQTPTILVDILMRWEQDYNIHQSQPNNPLNIAIQNIIKYIKMELTLSVDPFLGEDLYLIVRLKGNNEPLSFLSASIGKNRIVIRESLSAPQNVLTPYAEGSIRGAGSFAVAYLAQYALDHGIADIVSEVISQPSAQVKKKIGFRFTKNL